jgi:hypothetical protein
MARQMMQITNLLENSLSIPLIPNNNQYASSVPGRMLIPPTKDQLPRTPLPRPQSHISSLSESHGLVQSNGHQCHIKSPIGSTPAPSGSSGINDGIHLNATRQCTHWNPTDHHPSTALHTSATSDDNKY